MGTGKLCAILVYSSSARYARLLHFFQFSLRGYLLVRITLYWLVIVSRRLYKLFSSNDSRTDRIALLDSGDDAFKVATVYNGAI